MTSRNYEPVEYLKNVRRNGPGTYVEVEFHGTDFFNSKDKIDISKMAQHLTTVRKMAYRTTGFVFNESLVSATDSYFVIQCKLELKPALYKKAQKKNIWLQVKSCMELIGLGKSTMLFQMTIRDLSDGEILGSTYVRMAKVDLITRKSSYFSDDFLAKYDDFIRKGTKQLQVFRPNKAPSNGFSHQFVIRPSDTDLNAHTTNHVYTKLCLDCAHLAAAKYHFKRFVGDFDQPKSVERYFAKECGEGDVVDAIVWEDDNSTSLLYFQVCKAGILLFQANIDFYYEDILLSKL